MADVDGHLVTLAVASATFELDIAVDGDIQQLGAPPPPDPPPPVDSTPPTITNFSPAAGTGIASGQVLQFDITDESGIAAVVLLASFPSGNVEIIHDNDGFRGSYVGGSNGRTAIVGGYRYTVLRVGGWLEAPTIEFIPVDTSGNLGVIP